MEKIQKMGWLWKGRFEQNINWDFLNKKSQFWVMAPRVDSNWHLVIDEGFLPIRYS